MTPDDALMHQWVLEGLPPKVLAQHKKILGIKETSTDYTPHSISNDEVSTNRSQLRNNGWMKQRQSSLNSKNDNQISVSSKEKYTIEKDKSFCNTENVKGVSNFFKEDNDMMVFSPQNDRKFE